MSHYKDTEFFYYPADIRAPKPLGKVTLESFIKSHKQPKKSVLDIFDRIEAATRIGNLELKDKLKSQLYYFTPCVTTDGLGRSYSNIVSFNGLMVLDFDKIDNAKGFKEFLFKAVPSIIAAYLSPSKKGCKFIVRIPVCKTIEEFKSYFYGMAYYLEKYEGFDPSTQNCILPLYLSIDPELLYRDDATVSTQRGEKIDEFKPFEGEIEVLENVSEEEVEKVKDIISRSMGKIVDSGHYIVRSSALSLGGYVASGYLEQEEAEDFINTLIEGNSYCKKNLNGYKKTAKDMIIKGMKSPLYLT